MPKTLRPLIAALLLVLTPALASSAKAEKPSAPLLKTDTLTNLCTGGVAPASVCQNGVMDYVLHPVEPLTFRVTVAGAF